MMPRDPAFLDDLAHILRRHWSGLIRPLWHELPEAVRSERREAADRLVRFLESNGFTITRKGDHNADDRAD